MRMAMRQIKGTGKVDGDVRSQTLVVEYEPSAVSLEAIQQALRGVGYGSTVVT